MKNRSIKKKIRKNTLVRQGKWCHPSPPGKLSPRASSRIHAFQCQMLLFFHETRLTSPRTCTGKEVNRTRTKQTDCFSPRYETSSSSNEMQRPTGLKCFCQAVGARLGECLLRVASGPLVAVGIAPQFSKRRRNGSSLLQRISCCIF